MNPARRNTDALNAYAARIKAESEAKADALISDGGIIADYVGGMQKKDIYDKYHIKETVLAMVVDRSGTPQREARHVVGNPYKGVRIELPDELLAAVPLVRMVSRAQQLRLAEMLRNGCNAGSILDEFARMIDPVKIEDLKPIM